MTRASRAAGRQWRVLAHKVGGEGYEFNVHSRDYEIAYDAAMKRLGVSRYPHLPPTVLDFPSEFDELVIDEWFHLEQMDRNSWWMRVGDVDIWVRVANGKATSVTRDGEPL